MRPVSLLPRIHIFVCANVRADDSPLGRGCGLNDGANGGVNGNANGEHVFAEFKEAVARNRAVATVWVTKTHCLGICPKRGATVAVYPKQRIYTEVEPQDVDSLLRSAMTTS